MDIARFFAFIVALAGPAPEDSPAELTLKEGERVVALGDSLTASGGWVRNIDAVLAQQYGQRKIPPLINAGYPANRSDHLVGRFRRDVVDHKAGVVLINVGLSDVWQRMGRPAEKRFVEEYKENLLLLLEEAERENVRVILLSPTVIGEDPESEGNKRLRAYVTAMEEVARKKEVRFVNLHELMLRASKNRPADAGEHYLTTDGVHLSPVGNAVVAVGVLRALGVGDEKIKASRPAVGAATFVPTSRPTTGPATRN